MESKMMYKVSQATGKVLVWSALADDGLVNVEHGELGGKLQVQSYYATPKNEGRSNATSITGQAELEVIALYEDRYTNKHYRYTIEEAKERASKCADPRKVHNFKDHGHKLPEEVYFSVKLNGSRACILDGELFSKVGRKEDIKVKHIREAVEGLEGVNMDCEVYAHGLSLQRIRSAWLKPVRTDKEIIKVAKEKIGRKDIVNVDHARDVLGYCPNEDALKLQLWVFDIPVEGIPFKDRVDMRNNLEDHIEDLGLEGTILFTTTYLIPVEEVLLERGRWWEKGYEGGVIYSPEDMYEFGKRSYTCQKTKPRLDAEALVLDCTSDKSGQGVLHLQTTEEMGSIKFKAKMKGDANSRSHEAQKGFIGKWVTFSYEELSDSGVPTKPSVQETRVCDTQGNPQE